MLFLISLYKRNQHLQPVAFGRVGNSLKKALNFLQSGLIVCFGFDGSNVHGTPVKWKTDRPSQPVDGLILTDLI